MNEITVNLENLSDAEREQLLSLIEKSNKVEEKNWKPKKNELFYYVTSHGDITVTHYDTNFAPDSGRVLFGNYFKTEEEAKNAVDRMKIHHELSQFARTHNEGEIDWEQNIAKYSIVYDHAHNCFTFHVSYTMSQPNVIYFTSKEIAQSAIDFIGEERLKLYFGIED